MKAYEVTIRYNAYYHPQANLTERYNRTLEILLTVHVSINHRKWDVNLSKIACAIRTAINGTIKSTFFYVNFGRNMTLHGREYEKLKLAEDLGSDLQTESNEECRTEECKELFTWRMREIQGCTICTVDPHHYCHTSWFGRKISSYWIPLNISLISSLPSTSVHI